MFDSATLREELNAISAKLEKAPQDKKLLNLYLNYARQLRQAEYNENGYVTQRSPVTGY